MGYPIEIKENYATASSNYSPVSQKKSIIVARKVNGMPLIKAKNFLNGLLDETQSIGGKHYTKAAEAILAVVESAEANAKQKDFSDKLRIKTVTAEKGPMRLRRKKLGPRLMKICHLKVVLEDMDFKEKKEPKAKEEKTPVKAKETKPEEKTEKETPKADPKPVEKKEEKTEKKDEPKTEEAKS